MDEDGREVDQRADLSDAERPAFRRLLEMLHTAHGFDAREYKTVSLLRRIRTRMARVGVDGFDTYVDYLRAHGHEAPALFNTILVNVTGFFRDADAWQALRTEALPPLLAAAVETGRLRVWSAGCSTGEEAYSAAILIAEALGPRAADIDVKIYATDIDDEALVTAREAAFRTDQLKGVPAEVLARHFAADGHGFRVRRELRRWCVFGRHNLTHDPPLPEISLLICRNLLIYFRSALQERLLMRFHHALREGGILFLGRSESLMGQSRGFTPLTRKWRLFRRSGELGTPPHPPSLRKEAAAMADARAASTAAERPRVTAAALIRSLPYPLMLIGLDDSVREWNEAASALYEIPAEHAIGRQFRDLDISFRAEGLRARIEDVKGGLGAARLQNVMLGRRSGETLNVDFSVSRVYDDRSRAAAIVVAAWEGTAVARCREEIVCLGEQHATATEALQSTNEELETTNEELQATNEELETTNEELQARNEELVTTVDELQAANAELVARAAEIRRLLVRHGSVVNSVTEAIVILDDLFTVTAWNRAAERLFDVPGTTAIGRDFFSLARGTASTARATLSRLTAGVGENEAEDIEVEVPLGDRGTRRAVLRFARLVDSEGTSQGILGLGRPSS
jgi:two-component system CheB/CheR fusion protein